MGRAELIQSLKSLKKQNQIVDDSAMELEQAQRKVKELNDNSEPYKNIAIEKISVTSVIVDVLISIVISGVVFAVTWVVVTLILWVISWFSTATSVKFLNIIIASALAGISFVLTVINEIRSEKSQNFSDYINKIEYNKYVERLQRNKSSIMASYYGAKEIYEAEMKKRSKLLISIGIHEKYSSGYVLGCLIKYLEYGRADTLKEAINLYEHEEFNNRMQRDQEEAWREQQKLIQQQNEQLDELLDQSQRTAEAIEEANRRENEREFWRDVERMIR